MAEKKVRKRSQSFSSADLSWKPNLKHPRILMSPGAGGKCPRRVVIDFSPHEELRRRTTEELSSQSCKNCNLIRAEGSVRLLSCGLLLAPRGLAGAQKSSHTTCKTLLL